MVGYLLVCTYHVFGRNLFVTGNCIDFVVIAIAFFSCFNTSDIYCILGLNLKRGKHLFYKPLELVM